MLHCAQMWATLTRFCVKNFFISQLQLRIKAPISNKNVIRQFMGRRGLLKAMSHTAKNGTSNVGGCIPLSTRC